MDLPWGDERSWKFVATVGLITSYGPYGHNIMSSEWTHHVSYSPGLIAVCIGRDRATNENVRLTREFGVNIGAQNQSTLASIAGGSSGKNIDKIAVLKELGFSFYPARKIRPLMVQGAAMNAECKVSRAIELGDHTMFVGEVIDAMANSEEPIIYHQGKYWRFGEQISKPSQDALDRIESLLKKFRKTA